MRVVRSVTFEADVVAIQYMDDANDVRADGGVVQTHSVMVARDRDLDPQIEDLETAVAALLHDAIQAWATSLPFDVFAQQRQRLADEEAANEDEE